MDLVEKDSEYFDYNETTGIFTCKKAGKYMIEINSQMRPSTGTSNFSNTLFGACGFGYSDWVSNEISGVRCNVNEQKLLQTYSSLYTQYIDNFTLNQEMCCSGYARILSGTLPSGFKIQIWNYQRTNLVIHKLD